MRLSKFPPVVFSLFGLGCRFVRSADSDCVRPTPYELKTPPLTTEWTAQVKSSPWPEYPRPRLRRQEWLNLNGLWEFKSARSTDEVTQPPFGGCGFDRQILVPFPMESGLSGIMQNYTTSWYRKTFKVPSNWTGEVKLNFGAVDYRATIFLNGQNLGTHHGGYFQFSFALGTHVRREGKENELLVFVFDPSNSPQFLVPVGKQAIEPTHTFYTSSSGIWQTVFLEPVPEVHITDIKLNGQMNGVVFANISTNSRSSSPFKLTVYEPIISKPDDALYPAHDNSKVILRTEGNSDTDMEFKVASPQHWSPNSPHLYHVRVELGQDVIYSYFGLRSIQKGQDSNGIHRTYLNGQSFFSLGTLDQGYWPDGIYTPPTFEAMQYDLKVLKKLGFNSLRKHVKIESDLFYYACDRIGLFVWQDMPSINPFAPWPNDEQQAEFESQLVRMVRTHSSFPCIGIWVIFNEGWGQVGSTSEARLVPIVQQIDPTRLIIGASGWRYNGVGDFHDNHNYPFPQCGSPFYREAPGPFDPTKIGVQGEFGGIGEIPETRNLWNVPRALSTLNQTYELTQGLDAWNYRTLKMVSELKEQMELFACAGGIYTQTTDVEAETNGLMTYDRRILRTNVAKWKNLIDSLYDSATKRSGSPSGTTKST